MVANKNENTNIVIIVPTKGITFHIKKKINIKTNNLYILFNGSTVYFEVVSSKFVCLSLSPNTRDKFKRILFPKSGYLLIRTNKSVLKKPISFEDSIAFAVADLGSSSSRANSPKKSPDESFAKVIPESGSNISMVPSRIIYMPSPGDNFLKTGSFNL